MNVQGIKRKGLSGLTEPSSIFKCLIFFNDLQSLIKMKALIPGLIFLISIISESNAALFNSDVSGSGKATLSSGRNLQKLPDLPVIITTAKTVDPESPVAVIISGDGGWYKFEQAIADKLSLTGIPTIGLDTKKYFWNRRTPEETASDLAACIDHYNKDWRRKKFIFIGYSLGAEIVPFVINRLPDDIRSKVSMFILLSPAASTDFEIHISDMLGINNKHNTYKVIEEIDRIRTISALIIFGKDEKTNVPAMLTETPVKVVIIPGDHHYNHDTSLIVQTMKKNNAF
jgi:type IV secretory pathway VirJ component